MRSTTVESPRVLLEWFIENVLASTSRAEQANQPGRSLRVPKIKLSKHGQHAQCAQGMSSPWKKSHGGICVLMRPPVRVMAGTAEIYHSHPQIHESSSTSTWRPKKRRLRVLLLRMIKVKIVFCGRNMNACSVISNQQDQEQSNMCIREMSGMCSKLIGASATDSYDRSHRAVPPVMALLPPPAIHTPSVKSAVVVPSLCPHMLGICMLYCSDHTTQ